MQSLIDSILFWYVLCGAETDEKQPRSYSPSWSSELTASLLFASSLCHTRLVRSLGNLHVVADDRDPMCFEQCGSRRETASAPTNTGTLNLNMAHLQASSLRLTLSHMETAFAHNQFSINRCPPSNPKRKSHVCMVSPKFWQPQNEYIFVEQAPQLKWGLCKSSQYPEALHAPAFFS